VCVCVCVCVWVCVCVCVCVLFTTVLDWVSGEWDVFCFYRIRVESVDVFCFYRIRVESGMYFVFIVLEWRVGCILFLSY
jgi:hypothetical protein